MHFPPHYGRIFLVKTTPELAAQKAAYKKAFVKRTIVARDGAGFEPDELAHELGVKPNTYSTYERFVVMPHFLLPRFIMLTDVSAEYMLGMARYKRKAKLATIK